MRLRRASFSSERSKGDRCTMHDAAKFRQVETTRHVFCSLPTFYCCFLCLATLYSRSFPPVNSEEERSHAAKSPGNPHLKAKGAISDAQRGSFQAISQQSSKAPPDLALPLRRPCPPPSPNPFTRSSLPQSADEAVDRALGVEGDDVPDVEEAGHFVRHHGAWPATFPLGLPITTTTTIIIIARD